MKPAEAVFDLTSIQEIKKERKKAEEMRNRFEGYLKKIGQESIKPDFNSTLNGVIAETKPSEEVKSEIGSIMEVVTDD